MQLTGIQNIIFDFGGVILNIDHLKPIEAFRKMGIEDFASLYSQAVQSELFDRLETGMINEHEFRCELKKLGNLNVSDVELDEAWNSILLDIPLPRIQLVERLKSRYRTFLLSNTNEIHYREYIKTLSNTSGHKDFESLFERTLFSFQTGKRKPLIKTFNWVLSTFRLNPKETLFIDDSQQHIDGAAICGINSLLLKPPLEITGIFDTETLEINDLPDDLLR